MSTPSSFLLIRDGHVVDPANGLDGVADLWIDRTSGRVVNSPGDPEIRPDRVIDARGLVVMPGGIDVHCHIAGGKVNAARLMRPEEARNHPPFLGSARLRSGTRGSVPTTFSTGYQYAGLGYTFALDAAIAPLGVRHAHHELDDTPVIDKAFLALLGNNHFVMDRLAEGNDAAVRGYVAWLLGVTRAYGVKVVNPGGIERWKQGGRLEWATLDDEVPGFGVTPRRILTGLADAADVLALPHALHVHGLNLGLPGNAASTLELMRALDGHRAHLAHVQFHSYAGEPARPASIAPAVAELAEFVNAHPALTVDVGQVLFGETTSMTADGAVGLFLHNVTGRKWHNLDVEQETGCGVVPITYEEKNVVHALQWAIGLEWFLRVDDPWRVALSTDHPNGAAFTAYPHLMALLMSKNLRDEVFARLPAKARERSGLADMGREYSLSEIAIVTRAGPARILGLADRGQLGPGARADVTVYAPNDDRTRMFALPRYVIKAGEVVVDEGEIRAAPAGATLHTAPQFDPAIVPEIRGWFERESSIAVAHFGVGTSAREDA
jgi:formylmethanofuran dehydrogenase subunit A